MSSLTLTPVNGEPRIHDLTLAECLGLDQSRDIRKLIKRNEAKLLKFGPCATVARCLEVGNGAKQTVNEFYLNQKQAIFICMKSETEKAFDVQVEIVRVFDAYLNGELKPAPQPTLSAERWQVIRNLIHNIEICCKWEGSAGFAVNERIRFTYGLRSSSELRPEHFDDARTELEGLKTLACQHLDRMHTLDKEFITAVLRPPVSIRKVRAMAKKQAQQPPLSYYCLIA